MLNVLHSCCIVVRVKHGDCHVIYFCSHGTCEAKMTKKWDPLMSFCLVCGVPKTDMGPSKRILYLEYRAYWNLQKGHYIC